MTTIAAAVLEIGPRLGLIIVLSVLIITVGGYVGAWGGPRLRDPFSFQAEEDKEQRQAISTDVPEHSSRR
jgi:hypothetical protein